MTTDSDFYQCIKSDTTISEMTKYNYTNALRALGKLTACSIHEVMMNPMTHIETIIERYGFRPRSLYRYLATIHTMMKKMNLHEGEAYDKWQRYIDIVKREIETEYSSNEGTKKMQENYIPWEEIKERYLQLPYGRDRLILALYTLTPPRRCEWASVRIYINTGPVDKSVGNFMVLDFNNWQGELYFNKYKTVRVYGQYHCMLPETLVRELYEDYRRRPREWLFEGTLSRPMNENAFSHMVRNTLKGVFDKNLSVSSLRHIFITSLDFNRLSIIERNMIAGQMGHSRNTQEIYKMIVKEVKEVKKEGPELGSSSTPEWEGGDVMKMMLEQMMSIRKLLQVIISYLDKEDANEDTESTGGI